MSRWPDADQHRRPAAVPGRQPIKIDNEHLCTGRGRFDLHRPVSRRRRDDQRKPRTASRRGRSPRRRRTLGPAADHGGRTPTPVWSPQGPASAGKPVTPTDLGCHERAPADAISTQYPAPGGNGRHRTTGRHHHAPTASIRPKAFTVSGSWRPLGAVGHHRTGRDRFRDPIRPLGQ